jgi:hypothetical protein
VDWEPVILAYHHRKLVVPADPWMNVISGTDRVSGIPEGILKARESQGNTGDLREPWYVVLTKLREALTRVPIRPRSKGNTVIKEVNPFQGPRDSVRPETYREALIITTNKRAL